MRRVAVVLALVAAGCRQNDDPDGAKALYDKVNSGAGFKSAPWSRAPGFPERTPSFTAHSSEVEIWINEPMVKALAGPQQITAWPEGSIVVKEGFASATKRSLVAIMEKRKDGWYFTELDGDGEPLWSASDGKPSLCVDCHGNRASYSDSIYSFELPR